MTFGSHGFSKKATNTIFSSINQVFHKCARNIQSDVQDNLVYVDL